MAFLKYALAAAALVRAEEEEFSGLRMLTSNTTTPSGYGTGAFMYQRYSDANCTTPEAGHLAGPTGGDTCMDTTLGSGMSLAGPAAKWTVSGSNIVGEYYSAAGCTGTNTYNSTMPTGVCTASGVSGYYLVKTYTDPFKGYYSYQKYNEDNCTTEGTSYWESLQGPREDVVQYGNGAAVQWMEAECNMTSNLVTTNWFMASSGGSSVATVIMPIGGCTQSGSTTGGTHYINSCVMDPTSYPVTTAPSTSAPASTAAASTASVASTAAASTAAASTAAATSSASTAAASTAAATSSASTAAATSSASTAAATSAASTAAASTAAATQSSETSSATEGQSSETSAATEGASTNATTSTTTAEPVLAVKKVEGSYTVSETLPAGTTSANLLASTGYVTSKKTGLANALTVAVADVEITGFVLSRRTKRALASMNVETQYAIAIQPTATQSADDVAAALVAVITNTTTAASIQSETNTAMAAVNWASDATFASAAPSLDAVPTVPAPTVAAVAGMVTSGPFQIELYSDATCATSTGTVTGTVGTCTDDSSTGKVLAQSCSATHVNVVSGATCAALSTTVDSFGTSGNCIATGSGSYYKAYCGTLPGAGGATPAGAVKASAFGVASMVALLF